MKSITKTKPTRIWSGSVWVSSICTQPQSWRPRLSCHLAVTGLFIPHRYSNSSHFVLLILTNNSLSLSCFENLNRHTLSIPKENSFFKTGTRQCLGSCVPCSGSILHFSGVSFTIPFKGIVLWWLKKGNEVVSPPLLGLTWSCSLNATTMRTGKWTPTGQPQSRSAWMPHLWPLSGETTRHRTSPST